MAKYRSATTFTTSIAGGTPGPCAKRWASDRQRPSLARQSKMGSSMSGLEQRSYIVTGAGGSIGRAAALILARRGANVVVADIVEAAAEETVRLIRAEGGNAVRSEEHTSELQSLMPHSSPTRRSSDLNARTGREAVGS